MTWYKYDDNYVPVECTVTEASMWLTPDKKRIKYDEFGETWVSTVFLGLDHGWDEGPPVVWETMIFSPFSDIDQYQCRYTTYSEALVGHREAVDKLLKDPRISNLEAPKEEVKATEIFKKLDE